MRFRALPARAGGDAGPVRAASAPSLARPSECDVRQEPPQSSDEPSTSGSGCLGVIPRRGSAGWARGSRPGGGAQRRAPGLGLGGARPEEPGGGQGAPLLPATCPLMWHFFFKGKKIETPTWLPSRQPVLLDPEGTLSSEGHPQKPPGGQGSYCSLPHSSPPQPGVCCWPGSKLGSGEAWKGASAARRAFPKALGAERERTPGQGVQTKRAAAGPTAEGSWHTQSGRPWAGAEPGASGPHSTDKAGRQGAG